MKKGLIMLGGIAVLLFLFCSFVSGYEEGETGAPALDKIEVNDRADGIDITLVSSRPLDYTVYEADNPTRIVVDLIGTNIYTQLPRKLAVNKPYLKEVSLRWYGPAPEKEFDAAKVDLVEMVLSEKI
ncbi:MAG: AMIN domain-containing protein, partial [Candidatus Omnitrophica bacterium]|nr:AMIN domain-containing protein [Candidatus Omnitrophota bacterium]